MVSQHIGEILCGYEDAYDCDRLRGDSMLKMSVGRKPSDRDLSSQPTMTYLENGMGMMTLYRIGKLFVDEYIASFDKVPKRIILDANDTNANTYGAQQLTLFNAYNNEHCYIPLLIFDGLTGKQTLPMLRPGRRNKSLGVARIMIRLVEYIHKCRPHTVIEQWSDTHFASHEFMDWAHDKWYVRYPTGLSANSMLLSMWTSLESLPRTTVARHRRWRTRDTGSLQGLDTMASGMSASSSGDTTSWSTRRRAGSMLSASSPK